jgi:hypothetical protein
MEALYNELGIMHANKKAKVASQLANFVSKLDLSIADTQKFDSIAKLFVNDDKLDVYDFDNVNVIKNTYSGSKRNVIGVLKSDLKATNYTGPGVQEIDVKLLDNPNLLSYKYTRRELIEFTIRKFRLKFYET